MSTALRTSQLCLLLLPFVHACASDHDDAQAFRDAADSVRVLIGEVRAAGFEALPGGVSMGLAEGAPRDVFGLIIDAARTAEGHTLVLDDRLHKLVLFDAAGIYLDEAGGPGAGPGEYRQVKAVEVDRGGAVRVLDRGNRKIIEYSVEGDSLRLVREQRIPALADDFCTMNGLVYLLRGRSGSLVEVVDAGGEVNLRFGTTPDFSHVPEGPLRNAARGTMSGGKILCVPERDRVVVSYRFLPDVKAFTGEGRVVWETSLDEYRSLSVRVIDLGGQPGTTFAAEDDTGMHNMAAGLVAIGDTVVVQLAVLDWINRDPGAREVDTRFLSLWSGEEVSRSLDLPLLGSGVGDMGVAFINLPFPRASTTSTRTVVKAVP